MIVIPDLPPRYARKKKPTAPPPSPTVPVLVAASFNEAKEELTLAFEQPVSIAAYDGGQTLANVPANGTLYAADSNLTRSPDGRTIVAEGESIGPSEGSVAWLSVPASSGIVDASSGAAWAGCDRLALPFGI